MSENGVDSVAEICRFDLSKFSMDTLHHVHLVSLIRKQPSYPQGNGEIIKFASDGDLKGVKKCLERGCNINEVGDSGRTNALLMAIHKKNNDIVKFLLDNGADYLYVNNPPYCDTALHWAAYYKNPVACEILLQRGALGDIKNFSGVTPLDDATNHSDSCKVLIEEYLRCSIASRKRIEKFREILLKNPSSDIVLVVTNDNSSL